VAKSVVPAARANRSSREKLEELVTKMNAKTRNPVVRIKTGQGPIWIELYPNLAPGTTANFLDLADRQFYNGVLFHRYVEGHVIQAGDRQGDGKGGFIDPETGLKRTIALEVCPQLRHDRPGIFGMAREPKDRDSASSQFYITRSPRPHLDGDFAIFGAVTAGMDVVERLRVGDIIVDVALLN
jgi:cyclophilin family peptidyl-prolyl cis-trans isomerase